MRKSLDSFCGMNTMINTMIGRPKVFGKPGERWAEIAIAFPRPLILK
jgi:hypothetical protein